MALTEKQEQIIKEAIPDLYQQLADMQDKMSQLQEERADLLARMDSFENWRKALRMRIRTENSTV